MVKICLSLVLGWLVVSCNFLESGTHAASRLGVPDKELEQIIVWGSYKPENPNRLDRFRDEVIEQDRLKPGEVFEEKYEHLLDSLNENFYYVHMRYCYYRLHDKEPVFKDYFRIRLYDKKGKLLVEDHLRLEKEKEDGALVKAYLPHHKAGHEIRIVKLEGKEEVLLDKLSLISRSELTRISSLYDRHTPRTGWTFSKRSQCFMAPPIR